MSRKKSDLMSELGRSIPIVLGIVLIWRGLWYVMDELDILLFGGHHAATAVGGIILGLILLYLPTKDFQALERL